MKYTLRQYQKDSVNNLHDLYHHNRRIVLVSPTGSGKTVMAAKIIESATGRVLFIAHRRELINQCSIKLDEIGIDHGIIMSNHPRSKPDSPVQVASVQTLLNREPPPADFIIIDECHRSLADSYQTIVDRYPGIPVLGLTATPWRGDGQGLGLFYEEMLVVSQVSKLVEEGFLLEPTVHIPHVPDLTKVKVVGGDYVETELEKVMNERMLARQIVADWCSITPGRKTVLFACTVKHSMEMVTLFRHVGVAAEHLDCNTSIDDRDAILSRLRSGETTLVSNVGVLTEGWDLPELECVLLARPTKSLSLYMQMVGRGMRPHESKNDTIVIDHAGCTKEHGLATINRKYDLNGHKVQTMPTFKMCPNCMRISKSKNQICDLCGCVARPKFSGEGTREEIINDEDSFMPKCNGCESNNLVDVKISNRVTLKYGQASRCRDCGYVTFLRKVASFFVSEPNKKNEFARLQIVAREANYGIDWPRFKFYEIFDEWP